MNPVSIPMDPNIKLDVLEGEASEDNEDQSLINHRYANLIRSLRYLAIATWPDIAFSVNKLAQYTLAPKTKHWTAIRRRFRYLKGTKAHLQRLTRIITWWDQHLLWCQLGIRFWLKINQQLCNHHCRGSCSLELTEAKYCSTLNTQSQIHCSYPYHKTSYGINHSSPNSNFHYQPHQLYFQTTNCNSNCPSPQWCG